MQYLPCPFCGGLEVEIIEELLPDRSYGLAVYCECGAQGAVAEEENQAIALWNTRINHHPTQEEKL